jgi:2-polyprenyl-6-methoxyphenol hydroxylase-like FAD-dependent oxidoreductase
MERAVRRTIGIAQQAALLYRGRRPAFPQSAASPIRGHVISVGDAAFSHDPIGGRGLSFALGCAFTAGTVLKTWRDHPDRRQSAAVFYVDFVAAEKRRHLAFLSGDPGPSQSPALPSSVSWSAREACAPLTLPDSTVSLT